MSGPIEGTPSPTPDRRPPEIDFGFWRRRGPAAPMPELANDEVHVWCQTLSNPWTKSSETYRLLSPDEQNRANRFKVEHARDQFIGSRVVLRRLLAGYLGIEANDLVFSYHEGGKPRLAGLQGEHLEFNLSHSGGFVVCAIARQRALGVDIEQIRPDVSYEDIVQAHFSAREIEGLARLPPEARRYAFFAAWTKKEAYVKALGEGLNVCIRAIEVGVNPPLPSRFLAGTEPVWELCAFDATATCPGALVYQGPPARVSYLSWRSQ
jgi:4'-phosphopantetheinyl transferase